MLSFILKFISVETLGGWLLIAAAALAMVAANTGLASYYSALFSHDVLFGINDGLMVLFFLLIGLEIKREVVEGELAGVSQALLPALAALGGVVMPAIIYVSLNRHDLEALHGWATASATDIAFSLCVLSLCGKALPPSLRIFLTAVAVIDDLAAIIIIALFYTAAVSLVWLGVAAMMLAGLWWLVQKGVTVFTFYGLFGLGLWGAVLASGVHATVAGVLIGFMMPLNVNHLPNKSMLVTLEHALHPWVSYAILPVFALANSGISFSGLSVQNFLQPMTLGVIAGLFFGKQMGIMLFTWVPVKLHLAEKPEGATWMHLYGIALLAGIGFTMSLFIGGLAFGDSAHFIDVKLGIIAGSLISATAGYGVLRFIATNRPQS